MKKIIVFVLACIIAIAGLLFTELKEGKLQDADFVSTITIPRNPESADDSEAGSAQVTYGEYYYTVDDVAYYLAEYDELPENYMTKKEAEALGWVSSEGNLWDVGWGFCIGGDIFGNREGLLPDEDGRTWYECDVNYEGGFRGGERLVFATDGLSYYTADHYESFDLLYESWYEPDYRYGEDYYEEEGWWDWPW